MRNICNLSILNELNDVLPPYYYLQMTTAKKHEVSTSKLPDVIGLNSISEFHIIFVVPDVNEFSIPANLHED